MVMSALTALTVPAYPFRVSPTLAMALDPISVPQGHQPLLQSCCSRGSLQLPTVLPWPGMDPAMSHPGLPSSPQLSWLGGWEQTLVPGSVLPALAPPAPASWPWGSCWHGQHTGHQCRTTDAIFGSKQSDWEATEWSGHFQTSKLCQTSEAGWAHKKCPLRNGPLPSLPSRPPLVELAMVFQLSLHHQSQRWGLLLK